MADLAVRTGNACRDLTRRLAGQSALPPAFRFEVPLCNPATGQGTYGEQPLLLPHEVYGALGRGQKLALCATAQQAMSQAERHAFESYCASHNLEIQSCLPLALHGDGVPFTKNDSMLCFTISVAGVAETDRVLLSGVPKSSSCPCGCRGASPIRARTLFALASMSMSPCPKGRSSFGFPETCAAVAFQFCWSGACTTSALMECIKWSLMSLFCGRYPERDPQGLQFADKELTHPPRALTASGRFLSPGLFRVRFVGCAVVRHLAASLRYA